MRAGEGNPLDSRIEVGSHSWTKDFETSSLTRAFEKSSSKVFARLWVLGRSSMAWAKLASESPLFVDVKTGGMRGNLCRSLICLASSQVLNLAMLEFCKPH